MSIVIAGLTKRFRNEGRWRHALDHVDLRIGDGEMVALLGSSGSGKSTLLRHIPGLIAADRKDGGSVVVDGVEIQQCGRINAGIRRHRARIGMVFQQFNLVNRLRVIDNVLIGALHRTPWWRSWPRCFAHAEAVRAMEALHRVGMADRASQRAGTLSGGQQQRVAIARAMVQGARTVLGDEPIASLDPESARKVMETLTRINREDGVTVVVSLHQVDFALAYCTRAVALKDGRVVFDGPSQGLNRERLASVYGDLESLEVPTNAPASTDVAQAFAEARV